MSHRAFEPSSPLQLFAEAPTKSVINSMWVDGRYLCVTTEAGEFFRFDQAGVLQPEGNVCRPRSRAATTPSANAPSRRGASS